MKKLLLSALACASLMFSATAQDANGNYVIFGTEDAWSNGEPYTFDNASFDTDSSFSVCDGASSTIATSISGASGGAGVYYVGGVGMQGFDTDGNGISIDFNGTIANSTVNLRVNSASGQKLKLQFVTDAEGTFGYEFELATDAAVTEKIFTIDANQLTLVVNDNPNGTTSITDAQLATVEEVQLIMVCTENTGDCSTDVDVITLWLNDGTDGKDADGCPTGLFDFSSSNDFEVYPNPASNNVNFAKRLTNVQVYNAQGSLVETMSSANALNVSSYEAGVYFIKATEGTSRVVVK